ncbi:MAG: GIY-YIG nuclease family protein [Methanothrix sp.]|nr:GIY-YIG nuclease family protein [Methanothrix sp.]
MRRERNDKGIYTIIIFLPQDRRIMVGSLGAMDFSQGYYSYTGSARGPGGLKRVDRHIQVSKGIKRTRRWHIDYLLPHCSFVEAIITRTELDLECEIAQAIGKALQPQLRFGCTDCGCNSHLHYSGRLENMREVVTLAHAAARI